MKRLTWVSEPQGMTIWETGDIEIGHRAHHDLEEEHIFPNFCIMRRYLSQRWGNLA